MKTEETKKIVKKQISKKTPSKISPAVKKPVVKNPIKKTTVKKDPIKRAIKPLPSKTLTKKIPVKKIISKNQKIKTIQKKVAKPAEKVPVKKSVKSNIQTKKLEVKEVTKQPPAEYKSVVPKKQKPEIKISLEERTKLKVTEAKIKKMLNIEHLEELFHILNILNERQLSLFLQHYKNSEIEKSSDQKIDTMIKSAENYYDLLESLKKELATQLFEELEKLKEDISELNKHGIDAYIDSVKSMSIPLKIRIFSATGKREDFYKVKKMLDALNQELESKRIELKNLERQKEEREKAFDEAEKQKLQAKQKTNPLKEKLRPKKIIGRLIPKKKVVEKKIEKS